jgi:hypothetical protein
MGFFPQIWNDKTLERIKAALRETQRIVNSVMDYTPLTLGAKANTYNGPKLSGLTLQSFPVTTADDPSEGAISFEFDQRKGVVFNLNSIDAAQASVDMLDSLTADATDTILDGYDSFILGKMIDGLSSSSGFKNTISDTTGHKISRADFLAARKKLNQLKAPRRGRYCAIHPDLESDLFDIPDFISRDKIADTTAMRDGVIGRCLGFDILLADVPKVTNAWSRTAGTLPVALFYHMAAFGFGRNQELESMSAPDPKMPGDVVSLYSVFGGVVQEDTWVLGYRKDVA